MSVERQAATEVADRLHQAGYVAWFAGGCVRDELLGAEPKDYDVATDAVPEEVQRLFPRAVPVGAAFGVMLIRHLGASVEVATFREESGYTDRRRPDSVTFSDAKTDASRRDFTINGLFADPRDGTIYDFVGGRADLEARVLRAIGDPDARLKEDHLRMLRAVRFVAALGVTLEPDTEAAIVRHAPELQGVSRERVGDEVRRILQCEGRMRGLAALESLGLGTAIFGEKPVSTSLRRLECVATVSADIGALLAGWAADRSGHEGVVQRWRAALLLSNDECAVMTACQAATERFASWATLGVAARKRLAAKPRAKVALALLRVDDAQAADQIAKDIDHLSLSGLSPARLINGDALIADGMQPGPGLGAVLEQVYDAQLEGRVRSRSEAMQLARTLSRTPR